MLTQPKVEVVGYSEPINRDTVVKSIVVAGVSRTPFCRAGGRLATISAEELGAIAARDMLLKAELSPTEVDHVFVGATEQHITGQDLASVLARRCGIPDRAATMNLSGKPVAGMQALMLARNAILQGQAHTVLVVGVGSPSNYPVEMPSEFNRNFNKRRRESGISSAFAWAKQIGSARFQPAAGLDYLNQNPLFSYTTVEKYNALARQFSISREEMDSFALQSYERLKKKNALGAIHYLAPVYLPESGSEAIYSDGSLEDIPDANHIAKAKILENHQHGTATDLNTAFSADGAAALLLMSEQRAKTLGLKALARITAVAASDAPEEFAGTEAAFAMCRLLKESGQNFTSIDAVEVQETAAVLPLSLESLFQDTSEASDMFASVIPKAAFSCKKINRSGGGIAMGNALAASGPAAVLSAVDEIMNGAETAMAVSSGLFYQSIAVLLKR